MNAKIAVLLIASGIAVGGAFLAGCSGKLVVTDATGKPQAGIPFKTSQVWLEQGTYTKSTKGTACDTSTPFAKLTSLATGPVYFLQPEGAALSKTAFSAKFNEDGTLQEISFNSEPAAADTIKATTDLLKTALPALGIAGAASPPPGTLPPCDTGEKITTFTPFDKWLQAH